MITFIDRRIITLENEINSIEVKRDLRQTEPSDKIKLQAAITLKYARILELLNVRNELLNRNRAQENKNNEKSS